MTTKRSYNSYQREATYYIRDALRENIITRTYNLWLASRVSKELSPHQILYVMRKFWHTGSVGAWPLVAPILNVKALLGFAEFVPESWDMFDCPTAGHLVNERGFPYIPQNQVTIGVDVAVGYAMPDHHTPLVAVCEPYFQKILNDEMAIYKEIQSLKKTRLFTATPDSYKQVEQEMKALDADQAIGVVSVPDPKAVQAIVGGTDASVLQALYNARTKDENALNTFLGFDNVGSFEKAERMNDGEVGLNTAIIDDYSDSIQKNLDDWSDEVAETFGEEYRFKLTPTNKPTAKPSDEPSDDEGGQDDELSN